MSLDKLGILIIISLENLKKNVDKTFYKVKIQTQKFTQITKTGARQFFNILNLSISK